MRILYSPEIDKRWKKKWDESNLYTFDENSSAEKIYLLEMFSYPSASKIHLGHWWNYSLPDSWGRMKRMQGYNVFHPVGFDAFGLPAENYAIMTGIHPKDSTEANIASMEKQLQDIGNTYDWNFEIKTCIPEYYKWTQWLFLQLYHKGLAYRKNAPVNWCSKCKTVLANEQVINGLCERCDSVVIQKPLTQWFFGITQYAEELLKSLDDLNWPEKTISIQKNWIGKSEGADVTFSVEGFKEKVTVFTTRADTLCGLSYIVLAPENPLVNVFTSVKCKLAVDEYRVNTAKLTEIERTSTVKEKTGVFIGAYAINSLDGRKVPIWISDYVLANYGTGAVMGVPAHDERDYKFAEKFGLPIRPVIRAAISKPGEDILPYCEHGVLYNSGKYDGLTTDEAINAIMADLYKDGYGSRKETYHLHDWLISRQRYWGAPIPIVYCDKCGEVPIPEKDLPVCLPYNVQFRPDGKSPLNYCDEFLHTTCPCCGGPAIRETDTMDTFVCSSWYYLRFFDNHNSECAWDIKKVKKLMPVDCYVGGVEHAAMHLLYARFIYKALRDMGYVEGDEPFKRLIHQGTILGSDGAKMSKSRGNSVAPDDYVSEYGSDVFRCYLAFGFAYTVGGPWSDSGISSMSNFFKKVCRMLERYDDPTGLDLNYVEDKEMESMLHRTILAVTNDIDNFQFNTAVARLMEFRNAIAVYIRQVGASYPYLQHLLEQFILLFSPLAPHLAEEVWEKFGHTKSIFLEKWPIADELKTVTEEVNIAVQVNGKLRGTIDIIKDAEESVAIEKAMKLPEILKHINDKTVRKIIYVKNKILNIIV